LRGEVRAAEDAAEGNIFAEEQHALVGAEGCAEGVVDGWKRFIRRVEEVRACWGVQLDRWIAGCVEEGVVEKSVGWLRRALGGWVE
jgi:hypothetical protein